MAARGVAAPIDTIAELPTLLEKLGQNIVHQDGLVPLDLETLVIDVTNDLADESSLRLRVSIRDKS